MKSILSVVLNILYFIWYQLLFVARFLYYGEFMECNQGLWEPILFLQISKIMYMVWLKPSLKKTLFIWINWDRSLVLQLCTAHCIERDSLGMALKAFIVYCTTILIRWYLKDILSKKWCQKDIVSV